MFTIFAGKDSQVKRISNFNLFLRFLCKARSANWSFHVFFKWIDAGNLKTMNRSWPTSQKLQLKALYGSFYLGWSYYWTNPITPTRSGKELHIVIVATIRCGTTHLFEQTTYYFMQKLYAASCPENSNIVDWQIYNNVLWYGTQCAYFTNRNQ